MLPRLQAEEDQQRLNVLLAAGGRGMSDQDQRAFVRDLGKTIDPDARAPRVSGEALARLGIRDVTERESGLLTVGEER